MRKLIEQARRKADLDIEQCTFIPLSDGQQWAFERPWLEIRPSFQAGKASLKCKVLTCGDELDTLLRIIAAEDDPATRIIAVMTLGAFILKRSYDLEDADFERLLIYRSGDPDSEQMLEQIMDVATGGVFRFTGIPPDPPHSAVGSESA